MKKIYYILGFIFIILVVLFLYIKKNIQDNIDGEISNISITNVSGILPMLITLKVDFKIINNSKFTLKLNNFNVKIIDTLTNQIVTENKVVKELKIPIGESTNEIYLENLQLLGNANNLLNDNANLLAIISFSFYGIKVEFEQEINL